MTLYEILLTVKARWRSATAVFAVVVAIGCLITAALPKQYIASAAVVLDVKSADPIAGAVMPALAISSYMATQSDIIQSERVISRALRELKLDKDPSLRAKWREATDGRGDMLSWQTEWVLRTFEVLPSKESNVIRVEYKSTSPEQSAAMVNAVVRAYIATTIELRSDPAREYDAFFDERAKRLREAVEAAQARLSEYQREAGVVASDERLDVENTRLTELSSQLVTVQALAGESGSRQQFSIANAEHTPEVLASPLINGLMTELVRQEGRLNELRITHGEQHPDVQQLLASLTQLRSRIELETRKVTSSVAVNNSVNESRVVQVRAALDAQRSKVLRLKSQRDQAAVLQRDVDNATQAYSAAFMRVSQSRMESEATQTNVSTLKFATPPAAPARPRVAVNIAVAVFLGALLGVATAIARELRDQRLRTDDDVVVQLQQVLLGVLPDHSSPSGRFGRGRRLIADRLAVEPA
jgi:chain length determinant protein EpsF